MGAIGFLLVVVHVLPVIFTFVEFDGRPGAFYGLFTTNVFGSGLCRNAGFYDEPGALACWGVYALLYNKLFIGNKKIEKLLLVGLISTLSLAYFIQVTVYFFLFYRKKRVKSLVLFSSIFLLLKGIASIDETYNSAIFGRMEYDESTGKFNGDNRIDQVDLSLAIFKESPVYGVGASNLSKYAGDEFIGSNIFGSWAADGLLGQIILYSPLFYILFLGARDRKYVYAVIVLAFGFYQRPYGAVYIINVVSLFVMAMYSYLDINKNEKYFSNIN